MSGECDKCGEHCLGCSCEEMKEMMKLGRENLERQNALMDKYWPWLRSVQIEEEDDDE